MKCDSLSLPKYIDKSEKIFFIYGDEIVLQNNARDYICNFYKKNGFDEKKIITSKDFPNISQIITQNAGGSLFGSRIIVEIIHEGGKIPKDIMDILSFKNIDNLVFIIRSSISKISKKASWIKQMDQSAVIIECNKLKSFQEKAWLKDQLSFISEGHMKEYTERILDLFPGNLVAQQNEINLLKLSYEKDSKISITSFEDQGEFSPYELEDKIIELKTKHALRIIKSIHKNDDHYAQLLVWIIGKVINVSVIALQNPNREKGLSNAGIWQSKISSYKHFVKNISLKKIMPLQKKVYELDLASKGLGGITKKQFWQELDNIVIALTTP